MEQQVIDETQVRSLDVRYADLTTTDYKRGAAAEVSDINVEARTATFSFASELPVDRSWYTEVLQCTREAADLKRLNNGGALLSDHDHGRQIGKVLKAWIGDDNRGYCTVKFSRSPQGEIEFQDVQDDIRTCVSFGYRIKKYETEKGENGANDKITATRWEAFEISLVSVPADPTVGFGRAEEVLGQPQPEIEQEGKVEVREIADAENTKERGSKMENTENIPATADNFSREQEMINFGKMFGKEDLARQFALDPNKSMEQLRAAITDTYRAQNVTPAAPETPAAEIGMTEKEIKRYSISRAILAQADGDWSKAGFEAECHEAIVGRGVTPQNGGFLVPYDVQTGGKRDLSVGGGLTTGGALVGTDHMPEAFIEVLRSKMKMIELGVNVMSGLVGNPSVPRQDGTATAYWVAEGVAPTESQQVFGQLGLSPKTVGAVTEFTRQLLVQSAPSVDNLVQRDLAAVLARGIDSAIINGSGAAGQPRGILNTTGVSETSMAGASFAWADAVNFESVIAEADAPEAIAWLTRPAVVGTLKTRPKIGSTYPVFLLEGKEMNGYAVHGSTQVPANTLIFGDYSTIILGEWGVLEIEANRLGSGFRAGNIEVRGLHMVDVAVRYPQALKKLTAFA